MKRKLAFTLAFLLAAFMCITGSAIDLSKSNAVSAAESSLRLEDLLDMEELYGWATVYGDGIGSVTGGGNASPQLVTTLAEFERLAGDNVPRVIVISGKITCGSYGTLIGNNKTIVGIDKNAEIYGGVRIHNANNIIISNLNMHGTWPNSGPDDCLEIKNSHHLWLNHLNIWDSTDGNMDITLGSDYITVSWCKFWYSPEAHDGVNPEQTHRLSCLIGSGTGHDDTDMDRLKVTYHHNWFADTLDQRMPRVMYGRSHIFNNYYSCKGNTYCIGADCYASVLVENNYFKDVKNPHQFSYDNGFPACIAARGNIYDNTSGKKDTGQHNEDSYTVPFETAPYDYWLNSAKDTAEIVQAYAGAQNMKDAKPEQLKNGSLVKGTADAKPSFTPIPSAAPNVTRNDNPITYDKAADAYVYHGQNSDGTNAFYEIDNPFKGYDFSETPSYSGGVPVWTKGATISYWVNLPSGALDAPVLNFNLLQDKQIERSDQVHYDKCKAYHKSDLSYSMGTKEIYVDEDGNEYTVLSGYGQNVCYHPDYPTSGCYSKSNAGGYYHVYKKGSDPSNAANWTYLNFIGNGYYENYSMLYDEEGGEKSKLKTVDIDGSLSLYASGTMGYRQDNWTGVQKNPNLPTYGSVIGAHIYNQFYYWGNGSQYTLKNSTKKTPVVNEKGKWHFVVVVIQNDWIQFYMDGMKIDTSYLNWWGSAINSNTASDSFNLGYGQKMNYRTTSKPAEIYSKGKTILDFISDEDTVLTVGGIGAGAKALGQNTIKTEDKTQVKNLQFYTIPVSSNCILKDKIDLSLLPEQPPKQTDAPSSSESPKPANTEKPPIQTTAPMLYGDVDEDGEINLSDALMALKAALRIITLSDSQKALCDINQDGMINLSDAQKILKLSLGIE